jgi:hypothetical protein
MRARQPLVSWVVSLEYHADAAPLWVYVESVKRVGIAVLLPSVNHSTQSWSAEGRSLRPGLAQVRGLDQKTVAEILAERQSRGWFASLTQFKTRLGKKVSPKSLADLVRSGCFDWLPRGRRALLGVVKADTFAEPTPPIPWPFDQSIPRIPDSDLWRQEWNHLGFLCGPSLFSLFRPFLPPALFISSELDARVGEEVEVAGLLVETEVVRDEYRMAFMDEHGLFEVRKTKKDDPPPEGIGAWVIKGRAEDHFGAAVVRAAKLERAVVGPVIRQIRLVTDQAEAS